jgi:hypothetical protein
MSNLVEHAEREMRRAGLFNEDADYGGAHAHCVLELIKVFASQGHSGASAMLVRKLFHHLSNFENLTELNNDPNEWMEIGENVWQSTRNPEAFSRDHGKTYYLLSSKDDIHKTCEISSKI